MFRCKECQTEYETKPDYCDCGNDTFDEITVEQKIDKTEETTSETTRESIIENVQPQTIQTTTTSENANTSNKLRSKTNEISPFAWIFFAICVILSLLVIFVIGNPTQEKQLNNPDKIEKTNNAKIPPIDTFWNNSTPKVEVSKKIEETNNIKENSETSLQTNSEAKKKSINNLKTQNNTQKTVQNSVKKAQNTVQKQKNTIQNSKNKAQANPQELFNYKINLRNKIASRIDFASIVGDGTCAITFKISNSGQLINRNFAQQSDNNSLNDAVYNAMMQTPNYKIPPQGYNGETLKLTVKFYSGNFEVALN